MFKKYYELTKPGIIYGNAITAMAGFFLAEKGQFDLTLFVAMLIGLSFVIAAACVFNNILDKDIDAKMKRTKNRAMVTGAITDSHASTFGLVLVIFGLAILALFASHLAAVVAFIGFAVYVRSYTPLKRKTVWATLVGAVAGATPPVIGYTAVTNRLDAAAIILFLILVFWQMPHFYAIAIRRLEDYRAAGIPVLPAVTSVKATKGMMLFYCVAFVLACQALTVYGFTKIAYTIVAAVLGLAWLGLCLAGFKTKNDAVWAKQMFLWSLITITLLSLMLALNSL